MKNNKITNNEKKTKKQKGKNMMPFYSFDKSRGGGGGRLETFDGAVFQRSQNVYTYTQSECRQ